jgi:hypothetical protein
MYDNKNLKLQSCNMEQAHHKNVTYFHAYEYNWYFSKHQILSRRKKYFLHVYNCYNTTIF